MNHRDTITIEYQGLPVIIRRETAQFFDLANRQHIDTAHDYDMIMLYNAFTRLSLEAHARSPI